MLFSIKQKIASISSQTGVIHWSIICMAAISSTVVVAVVYHQAHGPPKKVDINSLIESLNSSGTSQGSAGSGVSNKSNHQSINKYSSTAKSKTSGSSSTSSGSGSSANSSSGTTGTGGGGTGGGTGGGSTCTTSNTSGCDGVGGKTITFTNVTAQQGNTGFVFTCTGSLASYSDARATITGSGWPVHLNLNYTPGSYNYSSGQPISAGVIADLSGVSLANGCTGDGDPNTIDLIVHIEGDGRTYGLQKDAFKINGSSGPSNIQLTTAGGSINCGPREGANALTATHQDGVQVQNGSNIGFYGVTVGNWAGQRATCWGAGGAFFISSANGHSGNNITISHMKAIACNHGLNGDASGNPTSGTVTNSVFRTGRPSDSTDKLASIDPDTGTNTVGLCTVATSPVAANTLGLSTWSFTNLVGDAWAQTGQGWSPGFNPAYNGGL